MSEAASNSEYQNDASLWEDFDTSVSPEEAELNRFVESARVETDLADQQSRGGMSVIPNTYHIVGSLQFPKSTQNVQCGHRARRLAYLLAGMDFDTVEPPVSEHSRGDTVENWSAVANKNLAIYHEPDIKRKLDAYLEGVDYTDGQKYLIRHVTCYTLSQIRQWKATHDTGKLKQEQHDKTVKDLRAALAATDAAAIVWGDAPAPVEVPQQATPTLVAEEEGLDDGSIYLTSEEIAELTPSVPAVSDRLALDPERKRNIDAAIAEIARADDDMKNGRHFSSASEGLTSLLGNRNAHDVRRLATLCHRARRLSFLFAGLDFEAHAQKAWYAFGAQKPENQSWSQAAEQAMKGLSHDSSLRQNMHDSLSLLGLNQDELVYMKKVVYLTLRQIDCWYEGIAYEQFLQIMKSGGIQPSDGEAKGEMAA